MTDYAMIWDMDGTLVNSYPSMVPLLQRLCREAGAEYSAEYIYEFVIGSSVSDFIDELARTTGRDPKDLKASYTVLNDTFIDDIRAIPHAAETLSALNELGVRCFVYTHRGASCPKILENNGLKQYFTEIVTILDGFPRKPEPDAVLYLIRKYGLKPEHCFYVGDRSIDIQTAHNAGIGSILYLDEQGPGKADGTETFVVRDLREIIEIARTE